MPTRNIAFALLAASLTIASCSETTSNPTERIEKEAWTFVDKYILRIDGLCFVPRSGGVVGAEPCSPGSMQHLWTFYRGDRGELIITTPGGLSRLGTTGADPGFPLDHRFHPTVSEDHMWALEWTSQGLSLVNLLNGLCAELKPTSRVIQQWDCNPSRPQTLTRELVVGPRPPTRGSEGGQADAGRR